MEKRQLREQIAFHGTENYKPGATTVHGREASRQQNRASGTRSKRPATQGVTVRSYGRNVTTTIPKEVRPLTWKTLADRREQLRRAHSKPPVYTELVPRTLAQTGMSASNGRIKAIQPAQEQHEASPVPVRSAGKRRSGGFFAKLLTFLAVLVIGVVGVSFALTSSAFRVQQVSVVGTQNPGLVNTIQHMGMQGQNIFLVDTLGLTTRISLLPLVASVDVEKQWPNQLTVTIVERIPVLLWQTQHGTYSVDKQGMVMAPASETVGADHLMTVVDMRHQPVGLATGGKSQPIGPGVRLSQADVAFALAVFAQLPRTTNITSFTLLYNSTPSAAENGSYVVASPNGWLAYLGGANDTNPLDNRLIELQQILVWAQQHQLNLATIDLRFGLRPVYTLKQ